MRLGGGLFLRFVPPLELLLRRWGWDSEPRRRLPPPWGGGGGRLPRSLLPLDPAAAATVGAASPASRGTGAPAGTAAAAVAVVVPVGGGALPVLLVKVPVGGTETVPLLVAPVIASVKVPAPINIPVAVIAPVKIPAVPPVKVPSLAAVIAPVSTSVAGGAGIAPRVAAIVFIILVVTHVYPPDLKSHRVRSSPWFLGGTPPLPQGFFPGN